jgi:hypothetical protein
MGGEREEEEEEEEEEEDFSRGPPFPLALKSIKILLQRV